MIIENLLPSIYFPLSFSSANPKSNVRSEFSIIFLTRGSTHAHTPALPHQQHHGFGTHTRIVARIRSGCAVLYLANRECDTWAPHLLLALAHVSQSNSSPMDDGRVAIVMAQSTHCRLPTGVTFAETHSMPLSFTMVDHAAHDCTGAGWVKFPKNSFCPALYIDGVRARSFSLLPFHPNSEYVRLCVWSRVMHL